MYMLVLVSCFSKRLNNDTIECIAAERLSTEILKVLTIFRRKDLEVRWTCCVPVVHRHPCFFDLTEDLGDVGRVGAILPD